MGLYGIILPIDELIFFKMVETTNQATVSVLFNLKRWENEGKMMGK
jgi:hypothetical protein